MQAKRGYEPQAVQLHTNPHTVTQIIKIYPK